MQRRRAPGPHLTTRILTAVLVTLVGAAARDLPVGCWSAAMVSWLLFAKGWR